MSSREAERGTPKTKGPNLGVIVGVIVGVILVTLIIFVVIWVTQSKKNKKPDCLLDADCGDGKICRNEKCVAVPSCSAPPATPVSVNIVYNELMGSATVSWGPSAGATSYAVFRKLNDPSVSKDNFDERRITTGTAENYTGLSLGTHYFVVLATNECGDSSETVPVLLAPSCDVVPTTPGQPVITQTADHCSDPQTAEYNNVSHDEATGDRPFNILKGTGQFGVSDYFAIFESPTGDFEVALACTGEPVSFTATSIAVGDYANLLFPTQTMTVGTSVDVMWEPVLNAEEYAVVLVTVDSNGTFMFTGGTVASPTTKLNVKTLDTATLVYASVVGYRLCDKSAASQAGFHITPTN